MKFVYRVEKHQFARKQRPDIDAACFNSKNLFNIVNYSFRQIFFANRNANGMPKQKIPKAFDIARQYASENQIDFRSLPANTAQRVIVQVAKSWKSYFAALRDFKIHPEKYKEAPSIPRYKKKDLGRNAVVFAGSTVRVKNGYILFPEQTRIKPVKTKIGKDILREVRIVPQGSVYVIEIIYKKEIKDANLNKDRALGIDLGVANIVAIVDNTGERQPIVVKGGFVKSKNQWFNKKKAKLQAMFPEKVYWSKQIGQITLKRNNQIQDFMHKTACRVIRYCLSNNIGTIVIGKNTGWKQKSELGKRGNQKFVSIPYNSLIEKIEYRAVQLGISVICQEESYTSKCDALELEPVEAHSEYSGKRIHRGLFRSGSGKLIHADVNGALNILRKAIGDQNLVVNWGRLSRPVTESIVRCFSSRTLSL
jgi:putative transposase